MAQAITMRLPLWIIPVVYTVFYSFGIFGALYMAWALHWGDTDKSVRRLGERGIALVPTISAVIGDYYPERTYWIAGAILSMGNRVLISWGMFMHFQREQRKSDLFKNNRLGFFVRLASSTTDLCRGLAGVGLTACASRDDFNIHGSSAVTYFVATVVTSLLVMVQFVAYSRTPSSRRQRISLGIKLFCTAGIILSLLVMIPFYPLSWDYLGPYSTFAACEWVFIFMEVTFDLSWAVDFRDDSVIMRMACDDDVADSDAIGRWKREEDVEA